MNSNQSVDEAVKMLTIPMKDLPEPAKAYLKHLSNKVGMCIEVCLTAYAHYNQAVLNMPCEDELYKIDQEIKNWFINQQYCS